VTLVMYDTIYPGEMAGLTMDAAAGYVDGAWATFATLERYVPVGTILLSITVFGGDAECVDQEPGNILPGPAADWLAARVQAGHWRPVLYTSAGNVQNMLDLCAARGITREQIRVWAAHYTVAHICGPLVCGYPQADGTQWTSNAHGLTLDQSELADDFFGAPEAAPVAEDDDMPYLQFNPDGVTAPVAISNAYNGGRGRIRFYANQAAAIRLDWANVPNVDIGLGYNLPVSAAIPAGANCLTIRRQDDSQAIVSYAMYVVP